MNKGFLFATSSQKIKSHVVESQITSLVWPFLSLTEKQPTVNHMIFFNDPFSQFYQYSVRNSPRQSANAESFAEAYLGFLVAASAKKMPRQLDF